MLEHEFADLEEKIHATCRENDLEFEFESSKFPIVAIIRPDIETRDQMRFDLGDEDEGTNYINGEIRLIFSDELTMKIINDFRIEDSLLNKIKNQAKKLHYTYLQMYFKIKTKVKVK